MRAAPGFERANHSMTQPRRTAAAETPARAAHYSISDLAREFALTTRAIRFYEDCGLLAPERRGRQRVYGERERVRIKLILRGKRLGLALAEIGELLDMYEVGRNERAQLSRFLTLLSERRAMLLVQREDIDIVLAEIDGIERECRRRLKEEGAVQKRGVPGPRAEASAAQASGSAGRISRALPEKD
jgi:DNA-binding transcriptional MerR regulator